MKKRMVAIMLGMVMLMSLLTGCGTSKEKEESSAVTEESASSVVSSETAKESEEKSEEIAVDQYAGTELTIAVVKKATDTTESFDEKLIVQMMEEATGIHVNWIEVDAAVQAERVDVMLLDKEQPDVYLGLLTEDQILTNANMFYDLSEEGLLEKYTPNVLKIYEEVKADGADVFNMLTLPDGTIRSLATNSAVSPTSDAGGIWVINQTWLDAVGMDIPTTADEFYEVLCAFRDTDLNGNGIKDEIPMSFCNAASRPNILQYANSFGIYSNNKVEYPFLKLENGVVETVVDTDEWRAYIEFYHKLISEGLVDAEGFSQTNEQFEAKVAENKVGVYSTWTPKQGEGLNHVVLRPFQALEGVDPIKTGNDGYFFGKLSGFAITKDSKNVEAALHWWDYLHSSAEIMNTAYCGEKDVSWFLDDNGEYTLNSDPEAKDSSKFHAIPEAACPLRPYRAFTGKSGERFDMVNEVRDMLVDYKDDVQIKLVDPLKIEERVFIETDLFSYIMNYVAEGMMNGVTDASWQEYLDGLKDYQYYEWIEWYQGYVDGDF